MATSMTLIASSTVGIGGSASIDFTSIPGTYTDLYIKWSARQDLNTTAASDFIYINGVQSSYAHRRIEGNGASPYSGLYSGNFSFASADGQGASSTANTFANAEMYFPNYTSSKYKSFSVDSVMENNATTAWAELDSNIWSNTAAITRLTLSTSATNVTGGAQKYLQYSTAYLYGIKNS
jgi:hypothetical protein